MQGDNIEVMINESVLWYRKPANFSEWSEALPVGNGKLGAMVFGGTSAERIQLNINTEMNYWPVEQCNLAECHEPLFGHIRRMKPNGTVTAQNMYGARGFAAHHNTDIWGDTAPQDTWLGATYWVMGAAWLCLHIWEHYEYTQDLSFLAGHFDLIKDACLFFADFLIENKNGELVVFPTISPENTYILPNGKHGTLCEGCAMDGQILEELIKAYEQKIHLN